MAEVALVVVLLVGLAAPLVLYLFIRDETRDRQEMHRTDAEAYARDRASDRYGEGDEQGRGREDSRRDERG
ncbi:hypothetical protein [Salinigranum halophilum]|jgi:hypothetical protein|uniref:hypothetical protein n=1 Tax=Salinigranum halophilum TaxID=2565931 RepID=UPI00115CE67C|nr:hypothetical protein [Salinigranum halophilum]